MEIGGAVLSRTYSTYDPKKKVPMKTHKKIAILTSGGDAPGMVWYGMVWYGMLMCFRRNLENAILGVILEHECF